MSKSNNKINIYFQNCSENYAYYYTYIETKKQSYESSK